MLTVVLLPGATRSRRWSAGVKVQLDDDQPCTANSGEVIVVASHSPLEAATVLLLLLDNRLSK